MIPEPPFDANRVYEIDLKAILADNRFNCRGVIDPSEVLGLARDIKARGLDSPVTVQPWSDPNKPAIRFRLVAGYRRYLAHQLNYMPTIRTIVRAGIDDVTARILNLTENIQRTELNILQEARAIETLKDAGLTQEGIASRVGKSRGWVQDRVYLLELPDEIQMEAAAGVIGTKDIRNIWSLSSTKLQFKYMQDLKDAKLKVKKNSPTVAKMKRINETRLRGQREMEELQEIIRSVLGTSFTTRVLGWCTGYVSDVEIHGAIAEAARLLGKFYMIPDGLSTDSRTGKTVEYKPIVGLNWKEDSDNDDDDDLKGLGEPDPEDANRGLASILEEAESLDPRDEDSTEQRISGLA